MYSSIPPSPPVHHFPLIHSILIHPLNLLLPSSTPRLKLSTHSSCSHCGCLWVWPQDRRRERERRRGSAGQIDTHIIAYQYLLSMRAEMIGNWSCFDLSPPPSASGSGVWLQRASVRLHENVWKYPCIHNDHMEVMLFDTTHLAD